MPKKKTQATPPKVVDPEKVFLQACFFDYSSCVLEDAFMVRVKRMQAAADAFEVTAAPLPSSPLRVARTFHGKKWDILPPTLIPSLVNGAFAIELYLKTLVFLDTGKMPTGHKLSTLFNSLSHARRKRLAEIYTEEFNKDRLLVHERNVASDKGSYDLLPQLIRNDDTFVAVRYVYELSAWTGNTMTVLRNAARRLCGEIKPGWRRLQNALGKRPTLQHR